MISFIIPTFQEEKTIALMLKWLRAEFNLVPYEIIVSDNQSTDQTLSQCQGLADHIIEPPKAERAAIGAIRNRGAALAKYPFLVFLDSGVLVPRPNKFFQTAIACFEKDPKLIGLTSKVKILPEVRTFADSFFCWLIDSWYQINNNFFGFGMAYGKFQMVKNTAFKQLGGFNEALVAGEDFDLFLRLSKIGKTRLEPKLEVFHQGRRMHKIGWLRLLSIWSINAVWTMLFKKALNKDWEAVR